MKIRCDISVGEYLDKLSILIIKQQKITDPARRAEVEKELAVLRSACPREFPELAQLVEVNQELWECNEQRKRMVQDGRLAGPEYCRLTVDESTLNDERFRIKSHINRTYGSALSEQKSYPWV